MRELCISVGVIASLARLAIRVATVFQLAEQSAHQPLADLEPLSDQRFDQMTLAPAAPAQRRARVTADRILDQRLKRGRQIRLMHHSRLAATTGLAGCRADCVTSGLQLGYSAVDCAASQPGCLSRCAHAPIALSELLIRREQPSPAFAEELFQQLISQADVVNVDHTPRLAAGNRVAPSKNRDSFPAFLQPTRFGYFRSDP